MSDEQGEADDRRLGTRHDCHPRPLIQRSHGVPHAIQFGARVVDVTIGCSPPCDVLRSLHGEERIGVGVGRGAQHDLDITNRLHGASIADRPSGGSRDFETPYHRPDVTSPFRVTLQLGRANQTVTQTSK